MADSFAALYAWYEVPVDALDEVGWAAAAARSQGRRSRRSR